MGLKTVPAWLLAGIAMSMAVVAEETARMNPEQIRENWGQVMYCQSAYRNPANQGRVYEYDITQCKAADQYMREVVSVYNETGRKNLRDASVNRMTDIQYSTRDITWVLNACRETCSRLALNRASVEANTE